MSDLFSRMEAKAQGDEAAYLPPQARPAWGGVAADLEEVEAHSTAPLPVPRVVAQPDIRVEAPASPRPVQEAVVREVKPLAPVAPPRAVAAPKGEAVERVQVSEIQLEKTRVETREITREIIKELRLVAPPPPARPALVASMEAPTEVQPPPMLAPEAAPVAKLAAGAPEPLTQRQASAPPESAAAPARVPTAEPAPPKVHIGHITVVAPTPPVPAPVAPPMPQAAATAPPAGTALKSYLGWRQ